MHAVLLGAATPEDSFARKDPTYLWRDLLQVRCGGVRVRGWGDVCVRVWMRRRGWVGWSGAGGGCPFAVVHRTAMCPVDRTAMCPRRPHNRAGFSFALRLINRPVAKQPRLLGFRVCLVSGHRSSTAGPDAAPLAAKLPRDLSRERRCTAPSPCTPLWAGATRCTRTRCGRSQRWRRGANWRASEWGGAIPQPGAAAVGAGAGACNSLQGSQQLCGRLWPPS